ncbi:MAG: molybdate ABC transporter substrate-binding protein [Ilumatobacteraceae bacterium]
MKQRSVAIGVISIALFALITPGIALFIPSSQPDFATDDLVELNVLAASSLSRAFTEVAQAFSTANTDISVTFSFAGSSTLAEQVRAGAPMDVVALADQVNMLKLASSEKILTSSLHTFARNRLAIITATDNPRGITSLNDLTKPDLTVVLCDSSQPCGRYADDILNRAGLSVSAASRESSIAGVLSRIRTGEADSGIGYASDALTDTRLSAIDIPDSQNVVAEYPIAIASQPSSNNRSAAERFVNFVLSPAGQDILNNAGFIRAS